MRGLAIRSTCRALVLAVLGSCAGPAARAGEQVPALSQEHRHPRGAFSFRTPADWTVQPVAGRSDALEASSGPLRVRIFWSAGEQGFDAIHVQCALERLSPGMEADPRLQYEHDFVSGMVGDRRFLDSAFLVRYDPPVLGHREWRQRALTVVGGGETICLVSAAPRPLWKKATTRRLLEGIVTSLTFSKPAEQAGS